MLILGKCSLTARISIASRTASRRAKKMLRARPFPTTRIRMSVRYTARRAKVTSCLKIGRHGDFIGLPIRQSEWCKRKLHPGQGRKKPHLQTPKSVGVPCLIAGVIHEYKCRCTNVYTVYAHTPLYIVQQQWRTYQLTIPIIVINHPHPRHNCDKPPSP